MVANPVTWTIHDLDAMPDDGGWKRYEIIYGELLVTRAPHAFHQDAASKLNIQLGIWSAASGLGRAIQTPGVIFTDIDAVIPDLIWASNERWENSLDAAGHFVVAPELIVEILSAGEKNKERDKKYKLKLYSLHGVQEYWIVNWRLKEIEIYRRADGILKRAATLLTEDTLTSPLLPGFNCDLNKIFSAAK